MYRITQRAMAQTSLLGLYGNLTNVQKLQQQLTSGKTINRPSDNPTGTNTSMITRQDMAGIDQQSRNITDGQTFLQASDSALQSMLSQVQRVRDLTVQAMNGGSNDATSLGNIATEVNGIRQNLLSTANQVVQGRPIFGGVTNGNLAYDSTGAFVGMVKPDGTPMPITRQVSDVESIRVDITGPEAFKDPVSGKDVFAVVKDIGSDVNSTSALSTDLGNLDKVINQMKTALADVGTRASRLQTAAQVNSTTGLSLQSQLSQVEDTDLPKTIMELQMQQTGYQAALSITAKTIQPTLLDFLR